MSPPSAFQGSLLGAPPTDPDTPSGASRVALRAADAGGRGWTLPPGGRARLGVQSRGVTHLRALRVAAHHVARVEAARRAEAARAHRRSRPECGARCRDGHACRARVVWSRGDDGRPVEAARCRLHGGASTGPRTAEGRRASLDALARGREVLRQRRELTRAEAAAAPG